MFKSGYVTIVGRTNVGKSTLLNYYLGEEISIVTPKPETTREKILGIMTRDECQIIFIDTPGIHSPRNLLGKSMVKKATDTLLDADIIIAMIEAPAGLTREDIRMFNLFSRDKKAILAINKVDLVNKRLLLPLIKECSQQYDFADIIPVSATKGDNLQVLLKRIVEYLPCGEALYPQEQISDKNLRFSVAEIIRKNILESTRQEVPHSTAVLVEELREKPYRNKGKITYVQPTVFVEKPSQKLIMVGKSGSLLKDIGQASRRQIEQLLNTKVYLDLWVKVYKNWRKDIRALRRLDYL